MNSGRPGSVFPNAILRLCAFHLIARNFFDKNDIRTMCNKLRKSCNRAAAELEVVRLMFWALVKLTETEDECAIMNQCIVEFIDKVLLQQLLKETTDADTKLEAHKCHTKVQTFYCNSIWPNHTRYCNQQQGTTAPVGAPTDPN